MKLTGNSRTPFTRKWRPHDGQSIEVCPPALKSSPKHGSHAGWPHSRMRALRSREYRCRQTGHSNTNLSIDTASDDMPLCVLKSHTSGAPFWNNNGREGIWVGGNVDEELKRVFCGVRTRMMLVLGLCVKLCVRACMRVQRRKKCLLRPGVGPGSTRPQRVVLTTIQSQPRNFPTLAYLSNRLKAT